MTIQFNTLTILVFALIAQGFFAGIVLVLKKENRQANRYLSLLCLFLTLWLCDTFFNVAGIYNQNPNFYFLPIYFSLGFGPLIYFYTKSLTEESIRSSPVDGLHFLPVILQFLFYLFLQTKDYHFRREFWINIHSPYTYDLELALSFISLLIYLIISRQLIRNYKYRIENWFSNIHRITLQWLNQLHGVLFALSFLWLIEAIGRLFWDIYPVTTILSTIIGVVILLIAIGGILQKDLSFTQAAAACTPVSKVEVNPEAVARIKRLMSDDALFLRQELTLQEFASEAGLSPRAVSSIINHGLGTSFIDFVNKYRIARFKELVRSGKVGHLSLLGIALESGFNSKSTFNRVFKHNEGQSPSSYLKVSQSVK